MRILITGATGLIGKRLTLNRLEREDQVVVVSRNAASAERLFAAHANQNITVICGDTSYPGDWQEAVNGCDAVIHLAGAGIADQRWSKQYKKTIVSSRIDSTHQVVQAIEAATHRPQVLINASAVGYYGYTGQVEVDETAPSGNDFLANLTIKWERQARKAELLIERVVMLRLGIVLDDRGGAFEQMRKPFKFMMGGTLGSGKQYMPWVHWRDVVGLIDLALKNKQLVGPVNVVAPEAATNRTFASALGSVLRKPALLPTPRIALRLVVGEFAKYITMSQRIAPAKALAHGYRFLYPQLRPALGSLINPTSPAESKNDVIISSILETTKEVTKQVPNDIKLLAIDVDGTLLRSDLRICQGASQACRAAERAGCVVVLATARGPRLTSWIIQALDLTAPTINYNGAVIWNPLDNVPQFHQPLDTEVAKKIIETARTIDPKIMVAVEVLDRWYTDRVDRRFDQLTDPDLIEPLERFLTAPITRLTFLGMTEQIQAVLEPLRNQFWKQRTIALHTPDSQIIQITHPLADKAIALQRVAKRLGVGPEQVMVIGDADNDLAMMEWAGFSVAVKNATDNIKNAANAIVPSNDDQGVARAIHRFILTRH